MLEVSLYLDYCRLNCINYIVDCMKRLPKLLCNQIVRKRIPPFNWPTWNLSCSKWRKQHTYTIYTYIIIHHIWITSASIFPVEIIFQSLSWSSHRWPSSRTINEHQRALVSEPLLHIIWPSYNCHISIIEPLSNHCHHYLPSHNHQIVI